MQLDSFIGFGPSAANRKRDDKQKMMFFTFKTSMGTRQCRLITAAFRFRF